MFESGNKKQGVSSFCFLFLIVLQFFFFGN